ncbi:MAG: hypothetical protein ACXVCE_17750, partial [Bacteriovorax sp.]
CKELGLYGREVVGIDGSKFKAVNSKKRNFNEDKLVKKLKDIEEKIEEYLKELDENDKEESSVKQPDTRDIKEKIRQFEERKSRLSEKCQKSNALKY